MNPHLIPLSSVSTRPFDLNSIQIAAPCRADWEWMSGNDRTRHCQSCAKNVYNLSALTRDEAVRLIQEKEGHLCVRLYRRTDGTVLTSDCTVGISALKRPRRAWQNLLAASVAAILGLFGVSSARAARQNQVPTMGAPMLMGEMVPTMGRPLIPKSKVTQQTTNHAKHATKTGRRSKSLQHRRHR